MTLIMANLLIGVLCRPQLLQLVLSGVHATQPCAPHCVTRVPYNGILVESLGLAAG